MPTKEVNAWDTDDQKGLPPGARRKSWRPLPYQGWGLVIDNRARQSRQRACRAAFSLLSNQPFDRPTALRLCREVRKICRTYWAYWDYDHQPTFGDVKDQTRKFRARLAAALKAFDELERYARREINHEVSRMSSDLQPPDCVGKAQAALEELKDASDRVLKPKYKKVEAVAVALCCDALAKMWEEVSGKKFTRTKRSDSTGHGLVFRSEGPRCVQAVMTAIDPEVGIDQMITWMVESGKKTGKK